MGPALPAASMLLALAAPRLALAREISELAPALRAQTARLSAVATESGRLSPSSPSGDVARTGRALVAELRKTSALMNAYQRARTRRGTIEERENLKSLFGSVVAARTRMGAALRLPAFDPRSVGAAAARGELDQALLAYVGRRLDDKLGAEGIADILTARGERELKDAVGRTIANEVRRRVEKQLQSAIGFEVSLSVPLKVQVRTTARRLAQQQIADLLFKVTSSSFTATLLSQVIINWVGPRLKELLRNKGNLDARVAQTLAGMESRRRQLFALRPDSPIDRVADALDDAQGALSATSHLEKDLRRAGNTALLETLAAGQGKLESVMKLTRKRFLMDSEVFEADFRDGIALLDLMARDLDRALARLPATTPGPRQSSPGPAPGGVGRAETCVWYPGSTMFPARCSCKNAQGVEFERPRARCGK